jgi:hypothetical protein
LKRIGMHCLSPVETECRLGERMQAAHGFATTSGDALWPERFTSGARAHHPNYFQGLRRKTVGQETLRESEPMQRADSCAAFSYLLIVCAWCQQYIRWQRVQPPEPLTTSHGICARCYAQMSREIEH